MDCILEKHLWKYHLFVEIVLKCIFKSTRVSLHHRLRSPAATPWSQYVVTLQAE